MSKIYSLSIRNYRGIKEFKQTFGDENLIVLIGRGDSGKTTILQAINTVLSPIWNLNISDLDFYNADVSHPIEIEATITDLPEELLTESKYGLYEQQIIDGQISCEIDDAPNAKEALTIKFFADESLEPKWQVISKRDGQEAKEISASDRAKLNTFLISDYIDSHFTLSKGAPLFSFVKQNSIEGQSLSKKLIDIVRDINKLTKEKGCFNEVDEKIKAISELSTELGINLENITTAVEYKDNVLTGSNIALHSRDIPYKKMGKGTKRLLSIAIQKQLTQAGGIILIDEIEQGLEPDRITSIIRYLKRNHSGQIFVTTHSSYVLVEANYNNVFLMKKNEKTLQSFPESFQGILRTQPEAFFLNRCICCEGKTEQGVIRGLDEKYTEAGRGNLSYHGIMAINSKGGKNFIKDSTTLKKLGHEVFVFCDNDIPKIADEFPSLDKNGIQYIVYEKGNCLETQFIKDAPIGILDKLFTYAKETCPKLDYDSLDISNPDEFKKRFGQMAKKEGIFKNFPGGEFIGRLIYDHLQEFDKSSSFYTNYIKLLTWMNI